VARGQGTVTVKFLGDVSNLKKASDDADGALGKVGGAVGGAAKSLAMVGIPALIGFGAAAVKAFAESEQVAAQTEAVLKSTGGVAKVTAGDVDKLAGSLSAMSGVDDELIAQGENVLLTFTKVRNETGKGNDVFNQATKAALDMSVALGTDMKSASMLMGKALNDPIKGMTALTRSGVSFTEAQKDQVKAMVAAGDTLGAQKLILKEMETQFGGSAKAAGETFAGQINKLKVTVGNFMEDAGSKLVPILLRIGEILGQVIPAAIDYVAPIFDKIKVGVMAFVDALKYGDVTSDGFVGALETIGDFIHRAIGWVQGLIAGFRQGGDGFKETGDRISGILGQLKTTFASAFGAVQAIVTTVVDFIKGVWRVFGDDLVSFAREFVANLLEAIRGFMNAISGVFDLIKAILTGKWGDAWKALKQIVDGVWDGIFAVVRNAVTNVIPTLIAGLGQALTSIGRTLFDGVKDGFKAAINWIIDRWNGLEFKAPKLPGLPEVTIGVPDIPRLAAGGPYHGMALVGEKGPELLVGGSGYVVPNNRLGGMGGNTYQINVTAIDPAAAQEAVVTAIREYERRNGTGWRT
jgi:phage-related protein